VAEALLQLGPGHPRNPREVDDRVLVLATGGMRTFLGTPLYGHVDEEFDKKVLAILASGSGASLHNSRPTT